MLALILAQTGELTRADLVCGGCEGGDTPKQRAARIEKKEYLGCLKRPIITLPDSDAKVEWSPALSDQMALKTNHIPDAEHASWQYHHAGYGGIEEVLGCYWDCCPRSYAEFTTGPARTMAEVALSAASAIDQGCPQYALDGETPTPRMKRLIFAATRAMNRIRAKQRADDREAAKLAAGR